MTLLRFDPFRELERWSDQAWSGGGRVAALPFDAYRRDQELVLHFDLPGVDPDSIEVTVERNALTVAAERRNLRQEGDRALVAERPAGRFVRQLRLGRGVSAEGITADYDAGVLTVTVPVADEVKPRRVAVSVGSHSPVVPTGSEPAGTEEATVAA